jgi:hypothetical protein
MLSKNHFVTYAARALGLLLFCGCPTKEPPAPQLDASDSDASTDPVPDGSSDPAFDASADTTTAPVPGKPLAYGCAADSECASGFCVDGVCCDARCDQQCAACNLVGGAGHCAPQASGDDTLAASPCTGAHTCGLAGCKLRNQQRCAVNPDCASSTCTAFYEDLDGDGYGSANALRLCEDAGASAPPGYSALTGDCCDRDVYTFPGQSTYFTTENLCGSWDYNCDGTVEVAFLCDGYPPPAVCGSKPPAGGPSCVGSHPNATHCH